MIDTVELIPKFSDLSKTHAWLIANKRRLIDQKKAAIKFADPVTVILIGIEDVANKAEALSKDAKKMEVKSVINTTNLLDSHADVHFPGIWDKCIKEQKCNYLVKEHNFAFDGIISDNVKVTTPMMDWSALGADYPGKTQVLLYTSQLEKDEDQTGMFDKYRTGKVKEHSVGMRYMKLALAMDNSRYPEEMKVWKDYYDKIANKADVDELGYFWAVTEAKNIEGSAVLRGSNPITPTLSSQETKLEPVEATPDEPLRALDFGRRESKLFNLKF